MSRSPRDRVFEAVWSELKKYGRAEHGRQLRMRIGEFLEDYEEAAVLWVCLQLVRRSGRKFDLFKSLHWNWFNTVYDSARVGRGAWKYHIWLEEEKARDARERDPIRRGLALWLDQWWDGLEEEDWAAVAEAKRMLLRLEENFFPGRDPATRIGKVGDVKGWKWQSS